LKDPTGWGIPAARFEGSGCDVEEHFKELKLVFDDTFCGDWAGAAWPSDVTCAPLDEKGCVDFVAKNPGAFVENYWGINYVEVYTMAFVSTTSTALSKSISRYTAATTTSGSASKGTNLTNETSKSIAKSTTTTSSLKKSASTSKPSSSTSSHQATSSSSRRPSPTTGKKPNITSKLSSISATLPKDNQAVTPESVSTGSKISSIARRTLTTD
jgi:hypothetical protein